MISELIRAVRDLGALEKRTEDVVHTIREVSKKLDLLADRITRLEMDQQHMRMNLKSEILSDIKVDIVRTQIAIQQAATKLQPPEHDA